MSAEEEFAECVRKRNTDWLAERIPGRGGSLFSGQIQGWSGYRIAQDVRMRSGYRFAQRIQGRCGDAFARRLQNNLDMEFAARILERSSPAGMCVFSGTALILFKQRYGNSSDDHFYKLLLRINQTWQNTNVLKEKGGVYRDALALSIVTRMERILKPKEVWRGQVAVHKELTVFRDIASIFVNRGSRPDLAKKAERDLVKILSREYRENNPEWKSQEKHTYQRQITHEELVTTRRTVANLEEQVNRQKTLLFQLQKKMETAIQVPEPDMNRITGEVMKRMEKEMHLERLRRGL